MSATIILRDRGFELLSRQNYMKDSRAYATFQMVCFASRSREIKRQTFMDADRPRISSCKCQIIINCCRKELQLIVVAMCASLLLEAHYWSSFHKRKLRVDLLSVLAIQRIFIVFGHCFFNSRTAIADFFRPYDVKTNSNRCFVHPFMQFQLNCVRDVITIQRI